MHTDRMYIGKIPVVIPSDKERKEIEKIVDHLLRIENKYCKEFHDYYDELNDKLLNIYSFTAGEQKRMRELINEVMSRKHNGR